MSQRTRRAFLSLLGPAVLGGCTSPRQPIPTTHADGPAGTPRPVNWETPITAPRVDVTPTVIIENLEIPWDLAFTETGDLFITERVGRVRRYASATLETIVHPSDAIDAGSIPPGSDDRPWWVQGGEGGTLGVAVHPTFPDPAYVYVYYTATTQRGRRNHVVRFDAHAPDPAATQQTIMDGIPAGRVHNGGRIEFGPDGYLWITTGDAGDAEQAQDTNSLAGKILRITPIGNPAPENPDLPGMSEPRVFTYGHRNPQGITWLPNETPIITEHGPAGRDEVSRLVPRANYGWPDVRSRRDYEARPGVQPPLLNTGPGTWAPSGCVFYTGDKLPSWKHRLLAGTLRDQQVKVITLTPPGSEPPSLGTTGTQFRAEWLDNTFLATAHSILQDSLGRIRQITMGPDGSVYAITSNRDGRAGEGFPTDRDDRLVRLDPP